MQIMENLVAVLGGGTALRKRPIKQRRNTAVKHMNGMFRHRRYNEKMQHTCNESLRKTEPKTRKEAKYKELRSNSFAGLEQNMSSVAEATH